VTVADIPAGRAGAAAGATRSDTGNLGTGIPST
jgi:hypothetical protein